MRSAVRVFASWLGFLLLATSAPAWPLRSPQVPVDGTALQSVFQQHNVHIDPGQSQIDRARIGTYSILGIFASYLFDLLTPVGADTFGVYDAASAIPTRLPLFPPGAEPGWSAFVTPRLSPPRTIVSVFDQNFMLRWQLVYAVVDSANIGLYLDTPASTYYSEDGRNPGHEPHLLLYDDLPFFAPDGAYIACEDQTPGGGTPGDFADVVVLWSLPFIDPVQHSTWAALKQRFH